jgi:hypothetical protein
MPPKKYPKSLRAKDCYRSLSRCYASVNLRMPKEYYDDTLTDAEMGPLDNFLVLKQVGRGKYGEVFQVRAGWDKVFPSKAQSSLHGTA